MIRLLDSIGLWFTDYYLLSAVLLLLALIALRRTRQPIHRLTIVKSTLVALALLAGLCALPGWSVVHLLTAEAPAAAPQPAIAAIADAPNLTHLIQATANQPRAVEQRTTPTSAPPVDQPTRRPSWNLSWHATLAAPQLIGACLVLIWLALGILAARRLRHSAAPASAELQTLLARLTSPTTVDLRTSNHITVPVALGLSRPTILLPTSFTENHSAIRNPQSEITPILAHELAHIHNHDLHWLAVSRALMILLWSQPLYWLARRRMRLDQESLADAAAAEVSSREQYAEQLVSWARNLGSRPTMRIASAVGLWEGPSQLRQRIALLLDERFIILRHFSRKLQFAAVVLCALTAAALSLVTLKPAQSKPQEKPAVAANTSSDSVKANEPDHITIDDRFILCPVTTELQRSLLGDVDAPRSSASLCIFANYGAYQGDAIEADSKFFAGLSEQLAALAKRDNRYVIASVQVSQSQISQPFEKLRGRAEQLSKLIEKRSRDAGFEKGTWSVTYGTTLGWSENAANAEATAKLAESNVEDSIGNEQVRVFPVRTFLSRMLMQDADCIVNIRPVWQKDDGPKFVDSFVPSLKRLIPELKYVRKELMYVRVRYAGDARTFVDQWSGNLEGSKKFGQELGFADSRNQQAGVSDKDAKQDKEARTTSPKRSAGPATRPELTPNTLSGRAVDDKGAPIAGAEVFLFRVNLASNEHQQIAQTKTDDEGNYRFANVIDIDKEYPGREFPASYEIGNRMLQGVIRAPGRVSTWWLEPPQFVAQQGRWFQYQMPAAATLEGHVTGPDGKPVTGALVAVSNGTFGTWEGASSARTDAAGYYKITDAPPFDLEKYNQQLAEQKARASGANGQGAWSIFAIKPTVSVTHTDFAELTSEFESSPGTKDLRLESPAILEGRVVFPDGKPAAGATVTATTSYEVGADGKVTSLPQKFYKTTVVADDNGNYRITSFPPGKYRIWADTSDWINAGTTAFASKTDETTEVPQLTMTKGGLIRVRLVDADTKQPISLEQDTRAMVMVEPVPPYSGGFTLREDFVRASAEGRFERRATPGNRIVRLGGIGADGELKWYSNERIPVQLTEGETTDVDVPVTKFTPQPTGKIAEIGPTPPAAEAYPDVLRDPEAVLIASNAALDKNPDDIPALVQHAEALHQMGRDRLAIVDYEQLLKLDLEPLQALAINNNLAFTLATSPDERLRNGKRAVELAKKAVGLQDPSPHEVLDTLAAAYAEAGDFDQAVKIEEQAIAAAPESYREEYEGYVKQYKAHEPRREAKDTDDDAATPKNKDGASSPSTPQPRKRVALTKVGESLISTTEAPPVAKSGDFYKAVETQKPLRRAPFQPSSAVAPTPANVYPTASNKDNFLDVTCVDDRGKPIPTATVRLYRVDLTNDKRPRGMVVGTTTDTGKCWFGNVIMTDVHPWFQEYPNGKIEPGPNRTAQIAALVTAPNYAPAVGSFPESEVFNSGGKLQLTLSKFDPTPTGKPKEKVDEDELVVRLLKQKAADAKPTIKNATKVDATTQPAAAPSDSATSSPDDQQGRHSFTRVGESLISTTDDKSADATAQFLVEPRSADQEAQRDPANEKPPLRAGAQTTDEAKNDDRARITPIKAAGEDRPPAVDASKVVPAMELVQIPVRVMNESGKPVVGATIEPLGIRIQDNDPKIELVQITDANGKATIPFPKLFIDEYGIPQFQVQVRHPKYIAITSQIRTDGKLTTLKLAHGGAVEINPTFPGGVRAGEVYGLVADLDPTLRWVQDRASGSIYSPQLSPGNVLVGAVCFPSSSGPLFSDVVTTKVVNGETQLLELDLKPGWQVSGRLADNVPRPVQNGRVMLQMISKTNAHMGWSDWTTVRDDGSFTFKSLPRDAGAEIRITAVCNGFISKTPDEIAKQYQLLAPQTFVMKENGIDCTLEMTPAAKCVVKVQDTQGKPLAGVQVGVQPAVLVDNGTSSFGDLNGMREMLVDGMVRPIVDRAAFPYTATSDESGTAELSNLPPFPTYISAASEDYSLPKNPIFALTGAPPIPILGIFLNSGETTTPTLTLIANKPSDTKTR